MKRKIEKAIHAFLDGELSREDLEEKLRQAPDGQEARNSLQEYQKIADALKDLPTRTPARDIVATVKRELDQKDAKQRSPWGRRVRWALAGSIIGATFVLIVGILAWPGKETQKVKTPEPADTICRVRGIVGEVVKTTGGKTSRLRPGDMLLAGDIVRVGLRAEAEIDIDPDARLILHRASRMDVQRLDDFIRTFGLEYGRMSVELLNGGSRAVRVKPHETGVVAEGRIGAFTTLVLKEGRAAFSVVRGSALISFGSSSIELASGKLIRWNHGSLMPAPEPVPEGVALSLTKPADPVALTEDIVVAGQTDSHARVWVNGEGVPVNPKGRFNTRIASKAGDTIEVTAEDVAGNTKTIEVGPLADASLPQKAAKPARKVRAKSYKVIW